MPKNLMVPLLPVRLNRITVQSPTGAIGFLRVPLKGGANDPFYRGVTFPLFASFQAFSRALITAQTGVGLKLTAEQANDTTQSGGGVQLIIQRGTTGKGARGLPKCPSPRDYRDAQPIGSPEVATGLCAYYPAVKRGAKHALSGSHVGLLRNRGKGSESMSNQQARNILIYLQNYHDYNMELNDYGVKTFDKLDIEATVVAWGSTPGCPSSHSPRGMLQMGLDTITACVHGSNVRGKQHDPVILLVGEMSAQTYCTVLQATLHLSNAAGKMKANSLTLSQEDKKKVVDCLNCAGISPYGKNASFLRKPVVVNLLTPELSLRSLNTDILSALFPVRPSHSDLDDFFSH
jgi:hypothetical protein